MYATILIAGVLWNVFDGDVEDTVDVLRGFIRAVVMFYLAKTIWHLKKVSWWLIFLCSGIFSIFAISAVILGLAGTVYLQRSEFLFLVLVVLPSLILLIKVFFLSIQNDVRDVFVH